MIVSNVKACGEYKVVVVFVLSLVMSVDWSHENTEVCYMLMTNMFLAR